MRGRLPTLLTALWAALTFIALWFATEIDAWADGWPLSYWWAAQGLLLVYLLILFVFKRSPGSSLARGLASLKRQSGFDNPIPAGDAYAPFRQHESRLHSIFRWYLFGLVVFLIAMSSLEEAGMTRQWIGVLFLFASVSLYAVIGIVCRTTNMAAYYVANRRIPPIYNGMASAADWMSAATFVSLAGGLYLQGFSGPAHAPGGLAYILGWTGGFVLLGLWLAPQLRRLRLYTLPDFFLLRFGDSSRLPLYLAAVGTILCSFTYLVAQIYGVGLITSRLTGVQFEIGIMLGLGGVLICSFLGGMRAVTWTQVAQYVILLIAFLIPASWLAYKQVANPIAFLSYPQQLAKIKTLEDHLLRNPAEQQVSAWYQEQVHILSPKIAHPEAALQEEREKLENQLRQLRQSGAPLSEIQATRRALSGLPTDSQQAQQTWQQELARAQAHSQPLAGLPAHSLPYPNFTMEKPAPSPSKHTADTEPPAQADMESTPNNHAKFNFMALIVCLVAGTMGLPHVLTRFYTTPTVSGARQSVAWTLFFITLIYLSIPAMATFVKYEVMTNLVGLPYDQLPSWMRFWAQIDPNLLFFEDVNRDGVLQFGELHLGTDVLVLAAPELAGLPFFVSGLVAAGGLAAALSTADGLLLTIGNALAFDMKNIPSQIGDVTQAQPESNRSKLRADVGHRNHYNEPGKRVLSSKLALLVIALLASILASFKPANILELVSASFSFAASIFTPALLYGLYSKNISARACSAGMLLGVGTTLAYMLLNGPWLSHILGTPAQSFQIAGIHPSAAGVFGMLASVAVMQLSLLKGQLLRSVL